MELMPTDIKDLAIHRRLIRVNYSRRCLISILLSSIFEFPSNIAISFMSSTPYSPPMENSPGNSAGTKLNLSPIDRKNKGKMCSSEAIDFVQYIMCTLWRMPL